MVRLSNIFWGLLLVFFGILLFLGNLGLIGTEWWALTQLWPLLFIYLGLLFFPDKVKLTGFLLLVMLISGFALFKTEWHLNNEPEATESQSPKLNDQTSDIAVPFDSNYVNASLSIEAGPGDFKLKDTTSEMAIISGHQSKSWKSYNVNHNKANDTFYINASLTKNNLTNTVSKPVRIRLNAVPVWDMKFDIGASEADFDLSPFKVNRVSLEAGASKIGLKLGKRLDSTTIQVDAGASVVDLRIPESSGCQIKSDADLSNLDFKDLEQRSEGHWVSQNFDEASSVVKVNLKAGLTHLTLDRY